MNKGFTLMELLIALTLVGVLMVGVVTSNSNLIHAIRGASEKRTDVQNIYNTFDIIEKDILSANGVFEAYESQDEADVFILSFIKTANKKPSFISHGSKLRVIYKIQNQANTATLTKTIYDPLFEREEEPRELLITTQKSIFFTFINEVKTKKETWAGKKAPLQIKLEIWDENNKRWHRTFPVIVKGDVL